MAVLGLVAAGCANGVAGTDTSVASTTISSPSDRGAPASLLFVVQAQRATVGVSEDGAGLTLALSDLSPVVTYFSDRPDRIAGQADTRVVARGWQLVGSTEFTSESPNAAVAAQGPDGEGRVIPVELAAPRYDGASGSLLLDIAPITGGTDSSRGDGPGALEPGELGPVSLFVDNLCSIPAAVLASQPSETDPAALVAQLDSDLAQTKSSLEDVVGADGDIDPEVLMRLQFLLAIYFQDETLLSSIVSLANQMSQTAQHDIEAYRQTSSQLSDDLGQLSQLIDGGADDQTIAAAAEEVLDGPLAAMPPLAEIPQGSRAGLGRNP